MKQQQNPKITPKYKRWATKDDKEWSERALNCEMAKM